MTPAIIIQLIATYGPSAINLITQLIALAESNTTVTSSQWATLISSIATTTAQTEMAKELAAAGIAPTDPRYIALVGATKPA
jgi:hypothetical protein